MSGGSNWEMGQYWALWEEQGVEIPAAFRQAAARRAPRRKKASPSALKKAAHPTIEAPPSKLTSLDDVRKWLGNCQRCKLSGGRNQIVFGSGNPKASLLFIGEGPGADEDAQGLPFVGRAGQLLTKIIEAMGLDRERDTYIANIVKCRPPGNRAPEPDEVSSCLPFLKAQVDLVKPKIVVALGASSALTLLQTEERISSLRGRFHPLPWKPEVAVMPTFHPAYLLRNPPAKKTVWDDMKLVMGKLAGEKA